jgi:signal transduction histidine kinase
VPGRASFRVAALIAWVAVALPSAVLIWTGELTGLRATGWLTAFTAFSGAYAASFTWIFSGHRRGAIALVVVELLAAFAMVSTTDGLGTYTSAIALVLIADQLPYLFSPTVSWGWAASQSAFLMALFGWLDGWLGAVSGGGAFVGFHLLVVSRSLFEHSERATHADLARANAELRATRGLLAETSRTAERLRIARDLHDTLGHYLTALSIRLDVATRLALGPAAEHVQEAHAITKLLLSDVRDVVGRLRESGTIDLAQALRALASIVGKPSVHLDVPEPFLIDDVGRAEVLVRCVQESITNATRHGNAENLWVGIRVGRDGLEMLVRDDGKGAASITHGHGLRGMQERFERYSGRIEFATSPGNGFEVRAFIPLREQAA